MIFGNSEPDFRASKEYLIEDFREYAKKNRFEAFWVNDELVGSTI